MLADAEALQKLNEVPPNEMGKNLIHKRKVSRHKNGFGPAHVNTRGLGEHVQLPHTMHE